MSSPTVSEAAEERIGEYAQTERQRLGIYDTHNRRALAGKELMTARRHDYEANSFREILQAKETSDREDMHRALEQTIGIHQAKRDYALHLAIVSNAEPLEDVSERAVASQPDIAFSSAGPRLMRILMSCYNADMRSARDYQLKPVVRASYEQSYAQVNPRTLAARFTQSQLIEMERRYGSNAVDDFASLEMLHDAPASDREMYEHTLGTHLAYVDACKEAQLIHQTADFLQEPLGSQSLPVDATDAANTAKATDRRQA